MVSMLASGLGFGMEWGVLTVSFGYSGSGEEIETLRANAYNQALSSEDPLFHASLYDWLVSRRMTDQLLEVRCPRALSPPAR